MPGSGRIRAPNARKHHRNAASPPRLHPPPTTDEPPGGTDVPAQELVVGDESAVRTQEALDALVGKEAARVKKNVLQPQERLVKAGFLNKMGGVEDTTRSCLPV